MTDQHTNDELQPERLGLLAEYAGPDELIDAARQATDDGYTKVEAYAPFAIIGIDDALKAKGTILPWIVLCCGLTGLCVALAMQCYMNGIEGPWWFSGYAYNISGKPLFSLPAFIPVTFEVIILLSAFGSFFGMILLNKLPKLSNPLFRNERFSSVTTDGFFLFVEADDPKYAEAETSAYLTSIGATAVEGIDSETEGHTVPAFIHMIGALATTAALLPVFYLWAVSSTTSETPRISLFYDMETQAKAKPQTAFSFSDGRAMRKNVTGTIARGGLREEVEYLEGYTPEINVADSNRIQAQFVSDSDNTTIPQEEPEPNWVDGFPEQILKLDAELKPFMDRGQQRYNIYCATCHGLAGDGDGLITQRAMSLIDKNNWILPTNLHSERILKQPNGKLYHTISYGIRKMPGYHTQISPEDRWAIVLYVRALQRTRTATREEIPAEELKKLDDKLKSAK